MCKIHAFSRIILKLVVVEGFLHYSQVHRVWFTVFPLLLPELYYFELNQFDAFHTTIDQSYYKCYCINTTEC